MPRRLNERRRKLPTDIVKVQISLRLNLPRHIYEALEIESERLSTKSNKQSVHSLIKALISSYLEKRNLDLIANPDD
jgi:hypothetical protein